MQMCVHGSLDYTMTNAYDYVHGSLDYTITIAYACVRGSLDYTITNAYVRAWFSRLYYHKRICVCVVL